MGRISAKFAGSLAAVAVAGFGVTLVMESPFAVRGEPAVVVTDAPCGRTDIMGCYNRARPNEIQVKPSAGEASIAHENLHRSLYGSFDSRWDDECYVSALLYAETDLRDNYMINGHCE